MNESKLRGLENELQSSQRQRLRYVSRKLLDSATVPVHAGKVQRKKPIAVITAD